MGHHSDLLRKKLSLLVATLLELFFLVFIYTHHFNVALSFLLYSLLPIIYFLSYFGLLKLQGFPFNTSLADLLKIDPSLLEKKSLNNAKDLALISATWLSFSIIVTYITAADYHHLGLLRMIVLPILLSPVLVLLLYVCFFFIFKLIKSKK